MMTIVGVQNASAQKANLTEANGWTQITELPADLSQYYFAIYDHDQDLGMVLKDGANQGQGNWTMWYTENANPETDKYALYTIDPFTESGTVYQVLSCVGRPDQMLQTEGWGSYLFHCTDNGGGSMAWGRTLFAYDQANECWTIQNGVYPNDGYLGPWSDVIQNNAEVALNKSGNSVGHFDIFAITRGQYAQRTENFASASEASPIDLTWMIENNGAERRADAGWTETVDFWTQNNNDFNGHRVGEWFFEHWQADGNIDNCTFKQTISGLPNGQYKVSVMMLKGASGCYVFANNDQTEWTADPARYDVLTVVNDNTLEFGIKLDGYQNNWVAFDDFQLYYRGASSLPPYELATGPMNANVAAEQAAAETTFLHDQTQANYEALLTAIAAANASIAEYEKMAKYITAQKATAGNTIVWTDIDAKYNNGEYINSTDFIDDYHALVVAALGTTTTEDTDMTPFIINSGFEFSDATAWTMASGNECKVVSTTGSYAFEHSSGDYLLNLWLPNNNIVWMYQDITGLPRGQYQISAVFASYGTMNINLRTSVDEGNNHTDYVFQTGENEETGIANSYTVNVVEGKLRIAVTADGFVKLDDFTLKYLGAPVIEAPDLTQPMNAGVKEAWNTAITAFNADRTSDEKYYAALTAKANVEASIAVYQTMAKYITAQKETAGTTINWSDIDTKYSTGEYVSATDFIADYHALVVAALGTTTTDNTDMTPYIINPSFEYGDDTWWAHYKEGDSKVYDDNTDRTYSNIDGHYFINIWNNNAEEKYIFQDLTNLPTGTYEVKAVFGSDADYSINLTGGSGGKEQATTFTTGADKNVGVEKTVKVVVDNGNLRLGANSTAWFKVDNFRLTFLTSEADMDYALVNAPMNAAVRTAQTDAETAYLANKSIENYNALVAAIDAAQASADIYVTIDKRIGLLDAQSGAVDVSALTTKYNNGEYVNADEVYTAYHDIVKTALANPTADTDMTPFIINPGFEFADNTGWNGGGAVAGLDGQKNIESYNSDNFNIYQVLTDLPNGTYTLTVQGFYRPGGNNNSSDAQNAELYGNDKSVAVKLIASEGKAAADDNGFTTENTNSGSSVYVPNGQNDGSLVFANAKNYVNTLTIIVSDGTATIGVRKNNHIAADWALFDNFTLTFTSADLPSDFTDEIDALIADIDLTKKMNGETRAEYEAAINAWNAAGGKTAENYGKVIAAAPKAQASIVAYERALAAINETLILLTETNVYTSDGYSALFRTYNNYMSSYNNELLDDNAAVSIHGAIFGSGAYQQTNVAAVPFLGSAWDDQGDYTWRGIRAKNQIFEENFWNYWVNTWSTEGANDGSNFTVPFMEYITDDNKTLTDRALTATVPAAPKETYTVTGFIRARVAGGAEPTGIGLRLLNENDEIIGDATIYWTRVGETEFWTARPTVSGDTPGEISATDGGELTTLKIQFYFEQTNSSWFAFKNMMYSPAHTVDAQDFVNIMGKMNDAIAYAESHTLGFDYKDDTHGTSVDEYTPYRHAEQLADLELLKAYKVALDNLIVEYNNHEIDDATFVQRAPRYILTNSLITKVAEAQWTPNTNEENAIFWRDNYTADDVVVLQYYNDDGTPTNARFNTILPTGWDLDGRTDAYNTRIQKNGVNTNAPGTWAVKGQTALFVKWNTNYGKQTGYTLPLKPRVKYAFQFNYCAWGNEGEFFDDDTEIRIVNKRTGHTVTVTDYGTSQGGGNETPNENWILLEGRPQQGNLYEQNWYMFRGEFITEAAADDEYTDDYEIYFDKQVKDSQQQIALGEITLVRAPEEGSEYVLDGNSKDATKDFTPTNSYKSVKTAKFTRTFTATGGAEGTWSTLVLPFKMDQKEVEKMLGEDVELAFYKGCDLEGTQYMLHFEKHKAGVLPNVPVMVYFTETKDLHEFEIANVVVKNQEPTTYDPQHNLDMVGTYGFVNPIPENDIYIGSDNNWKRSKGTTKLQPSRAYFRNVSGDPDIGAKLMGFSIDDEPTGIMAIDDETGTMNVTSGNIYSVDGRLVRQNATSLEGLQPGIYVVDGKKYMVK